MAKKAGSTPGDVVRYVPAPEPLVAAAAIAAMTFLEIVFSVMFILLLLGYAPTTTGLASLGEEENSVKVQQMEAFYLGAALLTLAMILSVYRKFFLPDVMIVKKRKLKYEDLM